MVRFPVLGIRPTITNSLLQYIPPSAHHLIQRQSNVPVASCSGVSGGGIAGIVLGTFFGTLLLVYFFDTVRTASQQGSRGYVVEERRKTRRKSGSSRSG